MIIVDTGTTNIIIYYTRYIEVHKYEIYNHSSILLTSGITDLVGYNGKIQHEITFNFEKDGLYTYKSYYKDEFDQYYLANQSLIRCFSDNSRLNENYFIPEKQNTFKNKL